MEGRFFVLSVRAGFCRIERARSHASKELIFFIKTIVETMVANKFAALCTIVVSIFRMVPAARVELAT